MSNLTTTTKYNFNGEVHEIKPITFPQALKWRDGDIINILCLLDGANFEELFSKIETNDEFLIDLLWKFQDGNLTKDEFYEAINRKSLEEFKEALWNAILNFTKPTVRVMIGEAIVQMRIRMKNEGKRLVKESLSIGLQSSQENPESDPTDIQ